MEEPENEILFIVPRAVNSLAHLACKSLIDLANGVSHTSEDDIIAAASYFKTLPSSLRTQLAMSAEEHLLDRFYMKSGRVAKPEDIYLPSRVKSKLALWRMVCFLPDLEDVTLTLLHVGFDHYSAEVLRFLSSDARGDLQIKNTCLDIKARWAYYEEMKPHHKTYETLLKKLLFRCVNLTEVTLGALLGDLSIQAVGESCNRLRSLTLDQDHSVTDEGFIAFAQSQRDNFCLQEIYLLCNDSRITLEGLSQVWLLPLHVKKLQCDTVNFRLRYGHDGSSDDFLKCPNGPSELTDLIIKLSGGHVLEILRRLTPLLPDLQNMHWYAYGDEILHTEHVWPTVKTLFVKSHPVDIDPVAIAQLTNSFPELTTLCLETLDCNGLRTAGSFRHLVKFSYISIKKALPFDAFSTILTGAKNIRIVTVLALNEAIPQFTDSQLCNLFGKTRHLENLQWIELFTDHGNGPVEKLPLTEVSASFILATCKGIQMLGSVKDWSVDLDVLFRHNNGHRGITAYILKSEMRSWDNRKLWYDTSLSCLPKFCGP